jgi:hypothetical protein
MGGITPRHGFPLHCRLRYFDAMRQRPGVPADVATLITGMTASSTTVQLVNPNQVEEKRLVLQVSLY